MEKTSCALDGPVGPSCSLRNGCEVHWCPPHGARRVASVASAGASGRCGCRPPSRRHTTDGPTQYRLLSRRRHWSRVCQVDLVMRAVADALVAWQVAIVEALHRLANSTRWTDGTCRDAPPLREAVQAHALGRLAQPLRRLRRGAGEQALRYPIGRRVTFAVFWLHSARRVGS